MQITVPGTILIVDDQIESLKGMCDYLLALGYRVTGCASGEEAIDVFAHQQFDLLITDLMMPGMDGIVLMKRAKERDPLMVCLVVTGHATIQTAVDAMKEGAFDFITKPLDWKIFRVIISRALEIRRLMESQEQMRISRDQARAYARRLAEVQERDRQRIAREFHDGVGQNLIGLGMLLNALLDPLTDRETGLTDQRLIDASDMVTDMTATLREIIYDFRPAVLDDFGLLPAIRSLGEKIAKLTEFSIAVQGEDSMQRLPDFEEISLYRIVQEALTNIAKHAKAQNVLIRMLQSGTNLMLDITDDGVGFDAAHSGHLMEPGTWGLLNMRERAEAIGGTLQIESKRGFGTRVAVHIRR